MAELDIRELLEFLKRSAIHLCLLLLVDRYHGPVEEVVLALIHNIAGAPNDDISDGSQPPMTFDLSLS